VTVKTGTGMGQGTNRRIYGGRKNYGTGVTGTGMGQGAKRRIRRLEK